jgi:hypothetical protein
MQNRIDASVLASPVVGRRLDGPTLRDQLAPDRPTLLAFVRHFG